MGVGKISHVHRLGERDHADLKRLIQFHGHAFAVARIRPAVIPVLTVYVRIVIIVKRPQRAVLPAVQRTVHHGDIPAADHHGRDMGAQLSLAFGGIDQLVFRQLRGNEAADRLVRRGQRGRAFPELVGPRHIDLIAGAVLQPRDLVIRALNTGDLLELLRSVFLIIQIVAVRIFHLLPADLQTPVSARHLHRVRSRRLAVRFGNGRHRPGIPALPLAVQRLHADLVQNVVLQLVPQKLLDGHTGGARPAVIGFALADNLQLIRRHVVLRVPRYGKRLAAGLYGHILGNIHLRFRDPALHVIDKFHAGDLRQVVRVSGLRDADRHLLDRNLPFEINAHRAVLPRDDIKTLFLPGYRRQERAVSDRGGGNASARRLNDHNPFRDRVFSLLRSADPDLLHHRRFLISAEIKFQLRGSSRRREKQATLSPEKLLLRPGADAARRHLKTGGFQRNPQFRRRLDTVPHRSGQIIQVSQIKDAVSVQIAVPAVLPGVNGVHQQFGIPAVQFPVPVQIASGQQSRTRGVRTDRRLPGIELDPVCQTVHRQGLGVGDVSAAGYPQLISAGLQPRKTGRRLRRAERPFRRRLKNRLLILRTALCAFQLHLKLLRLLHGHSRGDQNLNGSRHHVRSARRLFCLRPGRRNVLFLRFPGCSLFRNPILRHRRRRRSHTFLHSTGICRLSPGDKQNDRSKNPCQKSGCLSSHMSLLLMLLSSKNFL